MERKTPEGLKWIPHNPQDPFFPIRTPTGLSFLFPSNPLFPIFISLNVGLLELEETISVSPFLDLPPPRDFRTAFRVRNYFCKTQPMAKELITILPPGGAPYPVFPFLNRQRSPFCVIYMG